MAMAMVMVLLALLALLDVLAVVLVVLVVLVVEAAVAAAVAAVVAVVVGGHGAGVLPAVLTPRLRFNTGRFTVDAGSKALAAEVPAPIARVLGAEGFIALGPSEEHLPFSTVVAAGAEPLQPPARGSVLYLVPKHVRVRQCTWGCRWLTRSLASSAWGCWSLVARAAPPCHTASADSVCSLTHIVQCILTRGPAFPTSIPISTLPTRQICPSVNLAERAIVIDGDPSHPTETEVSARAHDLWFDR